MATRMMLAKQTALALTRMEATVSAMAQEAGIDPPSGLAKRHRDADVARRDLLTALADWLEAYHASVNKTETVPGVVEETETVPGVVEETETDAQVSEPLPEIEEEEEDTSENPVSKKRKR